MSVEFPTINKSRIKYKGFSSHKFETSRSFVLTDEELIQKDLFNRIFTSRIKGERIMMEDYGTSIPDIPFEMLDDETIEEVVTEIEFAIGQDPRIDLIAITPLADPNTNSLRVSCDIRYVELGRTDRLTINIIFER